MNEEIMQYQVYKNQLEQIKTYLAQIDVQKQNITGAIDALNEIKNTKKQTKILAPIASGIFIEANLSNATQVITNTGANTAFKKGIDETIEDLKKEIDNIEKYETNINMQKIQLTQMISTMENAILQKRTSKKDVM